MQRRSGADLPWWLIVAGGLAVAFALHIASDPESAQAFDFLLQGVGITVLVTVVAFALASTLGLVVALGALSGTRVLQQTARFYIEILRGIPMLVILLYVAFVGGPALVEAVNWIREPLGLEPMLTRELSLMWRAIIALMLGYSAFIAEVFRAGIQSVDPGQIEAAKALGLSPWQRFRLIVFPQAIRTILPPLGNDFVALVKDSSLVSVLGVADITQLAKLIATGSFRYFETYNVAAYLYLLLTISLSLALRGLERRLRRTDRARGAV